MKTLKELKKDFGMFTNGIQFRLDKLKEIMNLKEICFSFEEIDNVKEFYEKNYENPESIGLTYEELVNLFYAYIGEAFIHYCKGNWELSVIKNDEAYGTPIIINWGNDGEPHARISLMIWKTLIERKLFRETMSEKIRVAMKEK